MKCVRNASIHNHNAFPELLTYIYIRTGGRADLLIEMRPHLMTSEPSDTDHILIKIYPFLDFDKQFRRATVYIYYIFEFCPFANHQNISSKSAQVKVTVRT